MSNPRRAMQNNTTSEAVLSAIKDAIERMPSRAYQASLTSGILKLSGTWHDVPTGFPNNLILDIQIVEMSIRLSFSHSVSFLKEGDYSWCKMKRRSLSAVLRGLEKEISLCAKRWQSLKAKKELIHGSGKCFVDLSLLERAHLQQLNIYIMKSSFDLADPGVFDHLRGQLINLGLIDLPNIQTDH